MLFIELVFRLGKREISVCNIFRKLTHHFEVIQRLSFQALYLSNVFQHLNQYFDRYSDGHTKTAGLATFVHCKNIYIK